MDKKKALVMALLICFAISLFAGCSPEEAGTVPEPDGNNNEETWYFTDSAGREVELVAGITRVVPSGPLAQIVLFSLVPEMLVGLTGKWDPGAEPYIDAAYYNLPVLGQLYGTKGDLNLEEIAKVDPQVIVDIGEAKSSIVEDLDGLTAQVGLPAVHIDATLQSMGEAYRMLGKLLDREEQAETLARYCETIYNGTWETMQEVGDEAKIKLIYCTGEEGQNVIAKGSYFAEVLDLIGNNIAVVDDISSKGTGNPVDMEQIVLWDPEVIIFAPDSIYDQVARDETWQELTAVKNGRYYEVPGEPYNWMGFPPSVNRYLGLIWLTQLLYPDQSADDLSQEITRYYELFYHCDLTGDQYQALVANSLLKDRP